MTPTAVEPLAAGAVPAMWEPVKLFLWFRQRGGSLPLVYNCAV
jgi:hypothetical protein